jgi:hypothetical protein
VGRGRVVQPEAAVEVVVGRPVRLRIYAKDSRRAAAFYTAVFGWSLPADGDRRCWVITPSDDQRLGIDGTDPIDAATDEPYIPTVHVDVRGLSTAQLAARVYASRELLQKVETAQRNASADLIAACETVLDTGGVLTRLLDFAVHHEAECAQQVKPATTKLHPGGLHAVVPPVSILVTITAKVLGSAGLDSETDATDAEAAEAAGARIYRFPSPDHGGERQ